MRAPDSPVYFGGSAKLLEQWQAGRRFIAQVGQAVWTQTPHQDGAPDDMRERHRRATEQAVRKFGGAA